VERAGQVYVIGEVLRPTEIVLANPNLTVLQALAVAQGTTPRASLDKAKLVRQTPAGREEVALHLKQMLTGKADDLKLQPNDIIFVPGSATKGATKRTLEAALQTLTGMAVWGRY
jgi:polysaccharide export outer membrane protein